MTEHGSIDHSSQDALSGRTTLATHRANNFDFIRFLLAAIVIYSHSFAVTYQQMPDVLARVSGGLISGGAAVAFFFIISGFLISHSWIHSKNLRQYAAKRILRIYPAYCVVLLFCVLLVGPLSGVDITSYFRNPATYKFMELLIFRNRELPGVFEHLPYARSLDASLWTIRYEILCYGLLALIGMAGLLRKWSVAAIFLIVAIASHWVQALNLDTVRHPHYIIGIQILELFSYFLVGMLFYQFRENIRRTIPLFLLSLTGIACGTHFGLGDFTLPIFGGYALFYLAFSAKSWLHNFGKRGDLSYGVYLYGFPVQQLLVAHLGRHINPYTLFPLALGISVLLAICSWRFVEAPFLRLKPKAATAQKSNPNDGV